MNGPWSDYEEAEAAPWTEFEPEAKAPDALAIAPWMAPPAAAVPSSLRGERAGGLPVAAPPTQPPGPLVPPGIAPPTEFPRAQAPPKYRSLVEAMGIGPEKMPTGAELQTALPPIAARTFGYAAGGLPGLLKPSIGLGVSSSVAKIASGIMDFATTPEGASQMIAAGVPSPAQPVALAKFTLDMVEGGYLNAKDAIDALMKGDWQRFSDDIVGAAAMGFGAKATARGTLRSLRPPREVIESSAFRDTAGQLHYGANHPEALLRAGGDELLSQFQTRQSRNTPQFGYRTNRRPFISREEAAQVARRSGQQLEPFDTDAAGRAAPHSDQIAAAPGTAVPLGDVIQQVHEDPVFKAEREALDNPDILEVRTQAEEGQPFKAGTVATIDRAKGKIVINAPEYLAWKQDMVNRGLSEKQIREAFRSVFGPKGEEGIHLATSPEMANSYLKNMTAAEFLSETKLYTQEWNLAAASARHGREFTAQDIAFEAIRRRMQRLQGMKSSEVAEVIGRERWTRQSLEALNNVIFGIRKALGTDASKIQLAILDDVQGKVQGGIAALGGAAAEPAMLRREEAPPEGYVRLYTGSGGAEGAGLGGSWFSTKPERAATFGPQVNFVDVPAGVAQRAHAEARRMGSGTGGDAVLPNEWVKRAQPVAERIEPRVFELEPAHLRRQLDEQFKGLPPPPKKTSAKILLRREDGRVEPAYFEGYGTGPTSLEPTTPWVSTLSEGGWTTGPIRDVDKIIAQEPTAEPAALRREGEEFLETETTDVMAPRAIASLEQGAAVARREGRQAESESMYRAAEELKRAFPNWQEQAFPAALRRKPEGTPEMFLPDVPRGTVVEREGFAAPNIRAVNALADTHFQDISKVPSLETFQGELQSRFGAGVTKDAAYYAWLDAMQRRLAKASGEEIGKMLDRLKLWGDVAAGEKPGEAAPIISRTIADPAQVPLQLQQQFVQIAQQFPYKKGRVPAAARLEFTPALRKRYNAIASIISKLTEDAGPAPKKPLTRTEVGPEDIASINVVRVPSEPVPETGDFTIPEYESQRAFRTLTADERTDPVQVGEIAVRGARTSGRPVTETKALIALRGPDGKIRLVSAWRDGRAGPKVTNPDNPSSSARKIDANLLSQHTPVATMLVRNPVQRFRQVFENQQEFDRYFGEVEPEGTPGIRTSSFAGPMAGAARAQAGITGATAPPPAEAGLPLPPEAAPSETMRELTAPGGRRPIPTGRPLYRYPQTFPPQPAPTLARAAAPPATAETPVAPEPAVITPAKPAGGPVMLAGRYTLAGGKGMVQLKEPRPAALRRGPLADEAQAVAEQIGRIVRRGEVTEKVTVLADSASNTAHILAQQAEQRVRLASTARPGTRMGRLSAAWTKGDPQVLGAANALVEAKAVRLNGTIDSGKKPQLQIFRQLTQKGLNSARQMERSPNWNERRIGRAWVRNQQNLLAELEYADAHWNDPDLQATAARMAEAYREQVDLERSKGFDVTKKEGYDPHRYDAALWNGDSLLFQLTAYEKKILGRKFRESQLFPSYYHAGAEGPYLAVTRDGASLVHHRIRQGQNMILQNAWKDGLKDVALPDGRPLAIDPVAGAQRKWLSPKADYSVVPGANHLAIQEDYVPLVRALTDPSHVELSAFPRAALHLSQQIKHSILVGDFFHLGRMIYYGTSIMGRRAGFKSGWSVLDIAERDMPEAVRKGLIRQQDMDWANTSVPFGAGTMTRRALAEKFYREMGANMGRVQDALYKDLLTELSPTAGAVRRGFVRVVDPSVGRYNRFLFDKLTRGLMAEANVREFERQMKANPGADPNALMRDIARDVNNYFGNIGRQGWFKSKTWQDVARIFWLAPQWVEGLIKKESVAYSRMTGLSSLAGRRAGVSTLGTTGRAISRGMLFMVVLTQAINLITRRKPTWENEEKGHKWDAWIPGWGSDSEGFWLSPLAIFNEVSHDLYRLIISKPTVADAFAQIASNKAQPVTRALMVAITGQSPIGQKLTTTGSRLGTAAFQLAPIPISFGRVGQAAGHQVLPGVVSAPPPGAVQRQLFATAGIKIEPHETAIQEVRSLAEDFIKREGLQKEPGWIQVQTDQPNYTKLRAALRRGDDAAARRQLAGLRKTRTDQEILRSMDTWLRSGYTGSEATEQQFWQGLTDEQLEVCQRAQEQKQMLYEKFLDWFWDQP